MNKEITQKLFTEFPLLYAGHKLPITQNLMAFGFEFSNGWSDIILRLSAKLEPLIQKWIDENPKTDESEEEGYFHPMAAQAKEKFGQLRFYMDYATDEMQDLIDEAEKESWETCEFCGSKENIIHTTGWIVTICKSCEKERNENRKKFNEEKR